MKPKPDCNSDQDATIDINVNLDKIEIHHHYHNDGISPADQALLDGIEARAKRIAKKLAALDALTPPAN